MSTLRRLLRPDQPLPPALRLRNKCIYLRERLRGSPLPPATLMYAVTGSYDAAWYVRTGGRGFQSLRDTLQKSHIGFEAQRRVLDFGCGCGRVLRYWKPFAPAIDLHAVDYNPELVAWCRKLVPFAQIGRGALEPPLLYADDAFDLIYALSVFTHWSVALQKAWMRELARVLRPGGILLLTTLGDFYLDTLGPQERRDYLAGKPVVRHEDQSGGNACTAYQPFAFVRDELRQDLDLLHFYPRSALGNPWQDVYLLQKPEGAR